MCLVLVVACAEPPPRTTVTVASPPPRADDDATIAPVADAPDAAPIATNGRDFAGPLDQPMVTRVLQKAHIPEACESKRADRTKVAVLTVSAKLEPDGRVREAKVVETNVDDAALEACVTAAFEAVTMPEHYPTIMLRYPMRIGDPPPTPTKGPPVIHVQPAQVY
jgi:hypothetical protein